MPHPIGAAQIAERDDDAETSTACQLSLASATENKCDQSAPILDPANPDRIGQPDFKNFHSLGDMIRAIYDSFEHDRFASRVVRRRRSARPQKLNGGSTPPPYEPNV
jgi:hypothetical protein